MVLTLTPELEAAIRAHAEQCGIAPGTLAMHVLEERFLPEKPDIADIVPQDEWERELLVLGKDCGVSLSDEALSREEMYE